VPELAARFEHVALVDPPRSAADAIRSGQSRAGATPGFLHLLWTEAEQRFSAAVLAARMPARAEIGGVYKRLREGGELGGPELRRALSGSNAHPLSPEAAARAFRVLDELGLLSGEPRGGDGVVGVVSSGGTDLERSAAFRAYSALHSEAKQYLERHKQP
jgi:hypothetical protein